MNNYKPGTLRHARAEITELKKKLRDADINTQTDKQKLLISQQLIDRLERRQLAAEHKYNSLVSELKGLPWYVRWFLPFNPKKL